MKKLLNDFKRFCSKGNILELATGVMIGGAFSAIVTSLVNDLLMPLIGLITGGINLSGLFIALGSAAASDLAKKVGAPVEGNSIKVGADMSTGLPGLFAAGDCTGGLLQVSVAVGEGAKAAMSAIKFVKSSGGRNGN